MELLPNNVIGNIYVAGIQVALGYVGNKPNTQSFMIDPFVLPKSSQQRMYYTGDLGYYDQHGLLHYQGRKDRRIKLRGFRVNLDEVAKAAQRIMPAIKKAFALVKDDRLILWTEPKDIDTSKLRQLLTCALPAHAIPSQITTLEMLPVNANGKIDSKVLASMNAQTIPGKEAFENETFSLNESLVAEEWKALLGLGSDAILRTCDNFVAMGGHSVLQLALAARLKRKFKVLVTVKEVITAPNLGKLASIIDEKQVQVFRFRGCIQEGSALGPQQLSPPELDWWYRYTTAEQPSAFNIPFIAYLATSVDIPKLKISIETALSHHEVLRSRFTLSNGEPLRVLSHDAITVDLEGVDFDVRGFLSRSFDLAQDPLVRVVLTPSLVAFSASHIIMDLTAFQRLLADVSSTYYGKSTNNLPTPSVRQYFDVQQWSNRAESLNISFWPSYLDSTGSSRQSYRRKRSYRGSSIFEDMPCDIYQRMLALASQQQISLHQFALTVTGIVLQVLVGNSPIIIGSPYINRQLEEDHEVVGLFLEPLPICIDWHQETQISAAEMLKATKVSSQSALAHAIPWPALLQALDFSFPSAQDRIFNVVVTLHDNRLRQAQLAIAGVSEPSTSQLQRLWPPGAKFPLCVEFHARAQLLTMRLEYDSDIFSNAHARVLQDLLLAAIEGLLKVESSYTEIMNRIQDTLFRSCANENVAMGELCQIAKAELV